MRPLRKIGFLLDEFSIPSPAQQLLDRFLMGYPRDGEFRKLPDTKVSAYVGVSSEPNFQRRPEELHLRLSTTAEEAVKDADAVVIVSRRAGVLANEAFLKIALERAPAGACCFVHGAVANSLAAAREFAAKASSRGITLLAGTPLSVTWRLPPVELPPGTPLAEALAVVQVNPQANQLTPPSLPATLSGAELHALDSLFPVIERRRGGESGIRSVQFFEGKSLWRAGDKGLWSWHLLGAALSRSDSPQGDAVLDGRTQDLVRLGLVPKLARNPRGWLLEHQDGLRTTILALDGVVADFNFAVRAQNGDMFSAQIFRGPPPAEHHFSRLAAVMEDVFLSGQPAWAPERQILIAGLLEVFAKPASLSGARVETPGLNVCYKQIA